MHRFLIFLFLVRIGFAAETKPSDLVGSDCSSADDRVIAEVHFTIESDTFPEKQEGNLYFVPAALATDDEKSRNRSLAQYAVIKADKPFSSWGYSLALRPQSESLQVEITTDKQEGDSVHIERAASFRIERFTDMRIKKAGIWLSLIWKKKPPVPARAVEPHG